MKEMDSLTGSYTLKSFIEKCSEILQNDDGQHTYAMASMDISNFRFINDFYGMDEADQLVVAFSDYLKNYKRTVVQARVVGDQFRILMYLDGISINELAEELTDSNGRFCKDMQLQGKYSDVAWFIYSAVYEITDKTLSVRTYIDKSHYAKKLAKGNLDRKCAIYDESQYKDYSHTIDMIKLFEDAYANDRIYVEFQPKYSMITGEIIGAEVLGRIYDDKGQKVMPGEFIPVLEKARLISKFDMAVMNKTFEYMRKWLDEGIKVVPVSVNVSRVQLFDDTFVNRIIKAREKYNIPEELVEIEITESVFLDETDEKFQSIGELRKQGVRIDLDDFGSGYSSLNIMGYVPADIIKLDCGFVRKSLKTDAGKTIVECVINMLKRAGFEVICEGIETEDEARQIADFGCLMAQGFYFDRPMPPENFQRKLLKYS